MLPEEWPIAADAADRLVDPARLRGPSRLATVRHDFFLDPDDRLTEQERALMTAMLHDLIGAIAEAIGASVGGEVPEAGSTVSALWTTGLLDRPGFVALMLRRADEYRIASVFAAHSGPRRLPLLPRLVGDDNPAVAAAAMALVVARGRRRDGFGQPRIELADLEREDAEALVHAVASVMAQKGGDPTRLAGAAAALASAAAQDESLDDAVGELAEALQQSDRDIEEVVELASADGEAALVAQLLAHRAGIGPQSAWDHLFDAGDGGLALLARMASLSRRSAARLIADLGSTIGATSVEDEMGSFDTLDADDVAAALSHWRLPRAFRIASNRLGGSRG